MVKAAILSSVAMAAMALTATPALAGDNDGRIQVRVFGTAVLPDGAATSVTTGTLPAGSGTTADDNYVPTLAIEYFVTPNVSLETICCVTQHDVTGTGPLAGASLVSNANIIPATLTLKYHLGTAGGIRPYVGAGPSYFIFVSEEAGAGARTLLGATRQRMNDHFGVAIQAGLDVPLNDRGLSLSVDAKRYFLNTSAHWFNAAGTEVLATRHRINPWVISAGVGFRF